MKEIITPFNKYFDLGKYCTNIDLSVLRRGSRLVVSHLQNVNKQFEIRIKYIS